jgi:hypothetical protein
LPTAVGSSRSASDNPTDAVVVADYLLAIEQIEERLKSLLVHLERLAVDPRYAKAVATLRCFRSFETDPRGPDRC